MTNDIETWRHKEWLGLLQPVGLVVSPPALIKAQAVVNRGKAVELQTRLTEIVCYDPIPNLDSKEVLWIKDFPAFTEQVLEWMPDDLVGGEEGNALPQQLEVVLTDYGETLKPSYAVPDPDNDGWLMLVKEVAPGVDLDGVESSEQKSGWKATIQEKFERLLRETNIPIGILFNGTRLRLVYAPSGESSGHLTFPVQAMCEVSGRSILAALDMLLGQDRLFNVPTQRRLPKLLSDSREYQAEVSNKLANQVLDALWELLRGFQIADAAVSGKLLGEIARSEPQHIYGGLITTLMRLVFLLYAEDQGLMPGDDIYQRNYSVTGLYERLREDESSYPDTMNQRYGAWAWLLSLVRLVYDGGGSTEAYLPARHGQLFDPDEYPFLEGRSQESHYSEFGWIEPPRIPDGVIYRVLQNLLVLDGERLSYRSLDVEQIGSVYEAIMGYEVEIARGTSIAVRPKDVVVNIDEILAAKPADRAKILQKADCKVTGKTSTGIKAAKTPEEFAAALDRKVSARTPNLLLKGSLYLQPGEERRRTGSHYTPRKLTQPIVERTLRPVLEGLGEHPTSEQILSLKIADLAMGSGAFLVETCRQLAEKLVEAWNRESGLNGEPQPPQQNQPTTNADVEPILLARRLVAQRCLYGVDKNPFAVNLAKLSLWLVTLAKDYPFTFLDHALKCGDSLVGLTKAQIGSFGKDASYDLPLLALLKEKIDKARNLRTLIQASDNRSDADYDQKRLRLLDVEQELREARLTGDVKIAAFFAGSNKKQREEKEKEFAELVKKWRYENVETRNFASPNLSSIQGISQKLRRSNKCIIPFNWDIEYPEVFDAGKSGFDAIVGNPPFAGKNTTINANAPGYLDWLKEVFPESHGNSDLVAFFFRRAFDLLRQGGAFGLIATNTIAQGDTRSTGLRWICQHGGTIYNAQKRMKWVGQAAVVVSVVNVFKGIYQQTKLLDGREVDLISAFLFHAGGNENPKVLLKNANKSFIGSYVLGMGFTFDDSKPEATSIEEMHRLIEKDAKNAERIFPYIGGEEVNSSPTHAHHRYTIDFFDMSEEEAWQYPGLMQIIKDKVKPIRDVQKRDALRIRWWQYAEKRPGLVKAIAPLERVLVISRISNSYAFTFLPQGMVYNEKIVIFAFQTDNTFCLLQSRIHEIWVRFFSSTFKDDLQYTPSICFETFPFPENWETNPKLEAAGKEYYEYRAELMVRNNQGLTETYNRFHNPEENHSEIIKLRELHTQMDKAVLEAYGWTDIPTECEFLLDYEDEEDDNLTPSPSPYQGEGRKKQKKKPYRYRWNEETHDEVLARLLELNQKRADAEVMGGKTKGKKKGKAKGKKKTGKGKSKQDEPMITGFDGVME
ncbi:MAG: DNA methyltransferase [Cyanobacteria bacterium P01_A01_bin.80]